jgi:hypothetical protein
VKSADSSVPIEIPPAGRGAISPVLVSTRSGKPRPGLCTAHFSGEVPGNRAASCRPLCDGEGTSFKAFHVPGTSYIVILDAGGVVVYTGFGGAQHFEGALRKVAGAWDPSLGQLQAIA